MTNDDDRQYSAAQPQADIESESEEEIHWIQGQGYTASEIDAHREEILERVKKPPVGSWYVFNTPDGREITMYADGEPSGVLSYRDGQWSFTGNVDASARLFYQALEGIRLYIGD